MSEPTYPTQDPNQEQAPQQAPQQAPNAYAPSQVFGQAGNAQQTFQQQAQAQAQQAGAAYQQQAADAYRQAAPAATYAVPQVPTSGGAAAKKASGWVSTIISGLIGAVIATATTVAISATGILPVGGQQQVEGTDAATIVANADGGTTINVTGEDVTLPEVVAAKSLPSVVCIYVYQEQTSYGWFGQEASSGEQMSGLGSGVILSEDGYVITNYHVIEGESSLKVSVNNEQYDAQVVGTDPSSDLAVIKIDGAEGLTPIEVGSSSDLVVGEWVMTVGAPYGMEQSVGSGIVSAVSRSSASLQDTEGGAIYANLIQTDAPINPGNSGGALVDKQGRLVGINTLTASYSGSNSGVGFAIPSDYAVSIANQIIAGEEPSHAQLGVSLVTVDSATAQRYGLSVDEGAYVAAAYAGAAEAGIQEGDIITKINGKKVTSATDVILAVRSSKVGDTVSVEVNRDGKAETMDVTLGSDTDSSSSSSEGR